MLEGCRYGRPTFHHQRSASVHFLTDFSETEMQIPGSVAGRFTSVLSSTKIPIYSDAHSAAT
jgi:hypothetical protein